ncbi:putative glucan 1,3-alpha-glucosidase [Camellia lanceoleosa]|uniref:Glucan 1,3-alpha-glucosidase n=1 Tax=Camellia lanceoleosa TaxID=1840588 RepID=A0ACC0IPH3_9ERIC|nr:putative glucan 1,3-alpha-glucosidase [Camellia lanceoleosa]
MPNSKPTCALFLSLNDKSKSRSSSIPISPLDHSLDHLSLFLEKRRVQELQSNPILQASSIREPSSSSLIASHVTILDGDLTVKLIPKNPQTEDQNLDPPKIRFQVPDVMVPEFLTALVAEAIL